MQNWFDFRARLLWAYDGAVTDFARSEFGTTAIAAWFIRRGTVRLTFGNHSRRYGSGQWVFPEGHEGCQEFSGDTEILSIRFHAEWPSGETLFDRSRTVTLSEKDGSNLLRIGTRLAQFVNREFSGARLELRYTNVAPERYFELNRLFSGWLQSYITAMQKHGLTPRVISQIDERVRRAIHHMEIHPLHEPLRTESLASMAGLSTSQFNRLFLRDIGKTPAEYWNAKRMIVARLALLESKQNLKAVAYELGFASPPYFSRWVRKNFGFSPKDLRAAGHSRPEDH